MANIVQHLIVIYWERIDYVQNVLYSSTRVRTLLCKNTSNIGLYYAGSYLNTEPTLTAGRIAIVLTSIIKPLLLLLYFTACVCRLQHAEAVYVMFLPAIGYAFLDVTGTALPTCVAS